MFFRNIMVHHFDTAHTEKRGDDPFNVRMFDVMEFDRVCFRQLCQKIDIKQIIGREHPGCAVAMKRKIQSYSKSPVPT